MSAKEVRVPLSYEKFSENLPFVPLAIFYLAIIIFGLFFLFSSYGKMNGSFHGAAIWLWSLAIVCLVSVLFSLIFYSCRFLLAIRHYGNNGFISCFFFRGMFFDGISGESFWSLRFGDLLNRKYYFFKREQVLPKISLGIAEQRFNQKIRLVIENATVNLSLPASQIVVHKNACAGIMDEIRDDITVCVFKAFKNVYGVAQGPIKSPKEDPQSFIAFKEELKNLLAGKYYFFYDEVLDKAISIGVFNESTELAADSVE
jgi:hypothetical protein